MHRRDVDDAAPARVVHPLERAEEAFDVLASGEVHRDRSNTVDAVDGRVESSPWEVHQRDARSLRSQALCDREPDPGRRAGDERRAAPDCGLSLGRA